MAPPPLNPTVRYYPAGKRKCYWLPATANYQSPTRAELDAGVDLSNEVDTMSGWSLAAAMVDTPDLGSRFTSQVPGALTSAKNEIVFYLSGNSIDIRSLLQLGTTGYITVLWEGDVAGQLMDIFPVQVASAAPDPTVNKAGEITIDFAASQVPAIGVTIPPG